MIGFNDLLPCWARILAFFLDVLLCASAADLAGLGVTWAVWRLFPAFRAALPLVWAALGLAATGRFPAEGQGRRPGPPLACPRGRRRRRPPASGWDSIRRNLPLLVPIWNVFDAWPVFLDGQLPGGATGPPGLESWLSHEFEEHFGRLSVRRLRRPMKRIALALCRPACRPPGLGRPTKRPSKRPSHWTASPGSPVENVNGRIDAIAQDKPYHARQSRQDRPRQQRRGRPSGETEIRVKKVGDRIEIVTVSPQRRRLFGFSRLHAGQPPRHGGLRNPRPPSI